MISRASQRIRAIIALVLFMTSDGGAQLADALVFHGRTERPDVARWNAGDHCHSERCELGVSIVSPPPLLLAIGSARIEPPAGRSAPLVPADVPRSATVAGPLGSRAPPVHS